MKTFQKFNEDAKSINAFMKNTFMNNPTIKSITGEFLMSPLSLLKEAPNIAILKSLSFFPKLLA